MLYIWPYFTFFSWPVIALPRIIALGGQPSLKAATRVAMGTLPRCFLSGCFLLLITATVHWNTIVHPFTLADNRHYVFYVFRLLLRHPLVKYAVAPVYLACGWAALSAMDQRLPKTRQVDVESPKSAATKNTSKPTTTPSSQKGATSEDPVRITFVLVWLISTALSLITAPLVEPRYFIIPWVIWRLRVAPHSRENPGNRSVFLELLPLIIESLWYCIISAVTGYMFLYKGFEWPQEPGKVQRFMW